MNKITSDNNFCRVFRLPGSYPSDFCFSGGKPVIFEMVDWFNPIRPEDVYRGDIKPWAEYVPELREWLLNKRYVHPGELFVLITDFGESMTFGLD